PYLLLEEGDWILSEGGHFERVDADWFYNGGGQAPYWFAGGWPSINGSEGCVSYRDEAEVEELGCIRIQVPGLTIAGGLSSQICDTICLGTGVHCGITIETDAIEDQPAWLQSSAGQNGGCEQTRGVDTWITQTCWAETPNGCAPDAERECEDLRADANPDDVVVDYECSEKAVKIRVSQWQTHVDTIGPIFDFCYPFTPIPELVGPGSGNTPDVEELAAILGSFQAIYGIISDSSFVY